jgi:hypothetical protein
MVNRLSYPGYFQTLLEKGVQKGSLVEPFLVPGTMGFYIGSLCVMGFYMELKAVIPGTKMVLLWALPKNPFRAHIYVHTHIPHTHTGL